MSEKVDYYQEVEDTRCWECGLTLGYHEEGCTATVKEEVTND